MVASNRSMALILTFCGPNRWEPVSVRSPSTGRAVRSPEDTMTSSWSTAKTSLACWIILARRWSIRDTTGTGKMFAEFRATFVWNCFGMLWLQHHYCNHCKQTCHKVVPLIITRTSDSERASDFIDKQGKTSSNSCTAAVRIRNTRIIRGTRGGACRVRRWLKFKY